MGGHFVFLCLVMLTLVACVNLSPPRSGGSRKKSGRSNEDKVSANTAKKEKRTPGELFYGKKQLLIYFNSTDELAVYAKNYSMFPDALHFPYSGNKKLNSSEEDFLRSCLNVTLETNKDIISKYNSKGEVYESVLMRVLEFLCQGNYAREPNGACVCVGGLWVIVALLSFALQWE